MESFFYKVNETEYLVNVTKKKMKSIHYRFKDDHFEISCPRFVLKSTLIKGLDKYAARLIKSSEKEKPIDSNYIYLYGKKYELTESGVIHLEEYGDISYKNQTQLEKKLRELFLSVITSRVREYEKIMKVPSYRVTIRKMTSRYGSNSRAKKHLNFATVLMHYSLPIIDSVVVHELAHILVYNHSKKFYDVVYKYCPEYKECRYKLRKGIYQ